MCCSSSWFGRLSGIAAGVGLRDDQPTPTIPAWRVAAGGNRETAGSHGERGEPPRATESLHQISGINPTPCHDAVADWDNRFGSGGIGGWSGFTLSGNGKPLWLIVFRTSFTRCFVPLSMIML